MSQPSETPSVGAAWSLWISLVLLVLVPRLFIFLHPDTNHSTMRLYATYGVESTVAAQHHESFYALHAESTNRERERLDLPPALALEDGAGEVEYPPLFISWTALPVHLLGLPARSGSMSASGFSAYAFAIRATLAMADALSLGCLIYILAAHVGASPRRLTFAVASYGTCGACLYALIYDRSDIIVGMLMLATLAALLSNMPVGASLVLLGLAISFKPVAILLAPAWLVGSLPSRVLQQPRRACAYAVIRRALALGALTAGMLLPYLANSGVASLNFVRYHLDRGVEQQSLVGGLLLVARDMGIPARIEHGFGSTNITAPGIPWLAPTVFALSMVCEGWAIWLFWNSAVATSTRSKQNVRVAHGSPRLILLFAAIMLATGVCGSRVFSPQYVLWFLGLIPAIVAERRSDDNILQSAFLLVCLLTMLIYPVFFDGQVRPVVQSSGGALDFLPPTGPGILLLIARNALFLAMTVALWRAADWKPLQSPLRPCEQTRDCARGLA